MKQPHRDILQKKQSKRDKKYKTLNADAWGQSTQRAGKKEHITQGSLAPEHVCTDVKSISEVFEKSACEHIGYVRMLSWFVSITNGTCTLVDELLHCVAESIWREREQIESCVLHMRSALRYTHVSSMFPAYPFKWKFCEVVWCENFHKFTDAQVACFVRCLLGPAAICIGGVLAFLCLGTAVGRIFNNSFIAWCIEALLGMIVAVIWIGYKPKLFTLFSVVNILKFVIDCDCCEVY
ncbi:hypothetical protein MAR_004246 [Mya arenaria]|uniref:Uncharacterized protein n=2 Tax=Mya arenaria TaxID=6604 RepID=A0ABY7F484_MYAAR|nr:hypothetical protein MAR_004246 [Mya arenaria]